MRYFNTEGACNPREHYMVRLEDRLGKIKKCFVDRKKYVVINRGRQHGKTTTLITLAKYLENDYLVLSLDFQKMSTENFADAAQAWSKAGVAEAVKSILKENLPLFESMAARLSLLWKLSEIDNVCN